MARLGQVDILVNNAGATWGAAAEDHPLEAWDKVMNLNIRSIFLMSQAIGKHSMIPRQERQASSTSPRSPAWPATRRRCRRSPTTPARRAVVNFTRTLGRRMGQVRHQRQRAGAGLLPEQDDQGHARARRRRQHGRATRRCCRLGDDDDLKGATLLFASQAGKHITGQIAADRRRRLGGHARA